MSNLSTFLLNLEKPFNETNSYGMVFASECQFAAQQLERNKDALATARNNQVSLSHAVKNVAAIGVSLNPASAHAYLVPRKGVICLDISYRGLVKLATDAGAIEWAKATLVYEGDEFEWCGPATPPIHKADVFNPERIDPKQPLNGLKGGYCLAKLPSGDLLVDVMSAGEIYAVRDTSKAKNGPWAGQWAGEMAKKTIIKRASKSWPQTGNRQRFDAAVEVLNEHEGLEERHEIEVSDFIQPSPQQTETYLDLAKNGTPLDFWVWYNAQDEAIKTTLPGCEFKRGEKGKAMAAFNAKLEEGRRMWEDYRADLAACAEAEDDHGAMEILEELNEGQREVMMDTLTVEQSGFVARLVA